MSVKTNLYKLLIVILGFAMLSLSTGKNKQIRIFMAGDSTMMDYQDSWYPQKGWGEVLPSYFNDQVEIINMAIGGRSTKKFKKEGRWDKLVAQLHEGDFVIN